MSRQRRKAETLSLTLHTARPLLSEVALRKLQGALRAVLPRWCRRMRVGLDMDSQEKFDVSRAGTLARAVRRIIAPWPTYKALVEEFGAGPYERDSGAVTLTGNYRGVVVILLLDEWVFSPVQGGQRFGSTLCVDVSRAEVEGMPAATWLAGACGTLCNSLDFLFGHAGADGEYDAWNRVEQQYCGVDPSRHLPGVYWLNVLGKPYVRLIGRERLLSAPVAHGTRANGHILLRVGDDPFAWRTRGHRDAIRGVLDHLGPRYFFDPRSPHRKNEAPAFRFESTGVEAKLRGRERL